MRVNILIEMVIQSCLTLTTILGTAKEENGRYNIEREKHVGETEREREGQEDIELGNETK